MDLIKEYYDQVKVPSLVLKNRLDMLNRNIDIKEEFEYWIKNKTYQEKTCVEVEGYTAESISKLSRYMVGEGSFILLIELRENPEKAKKRIKEGFSII